MNKILSSGLVLSAMLSLVGCGGGSQSSATSTATTAFGKFIDAPVKGLHYTSATHQGYTDENGIFKYVKGENVTFSLGTIEIGKAKGGLLVSPHDIAQEVGDTNDMAVKIAVLLQNLDADKSDKGTIDLSKLKDFNFTGVVDINFSDPTLDIEAKVAEIVDPVVTPELATLLDDNKTIIDKQTAVDNMNTYIAEAAALAEAEAAAKAALTTFVSGNTFAFDEESAVGPDITLIFGADGIYTEVFPEGTCSGPWAVISDTMIGANCDSTVVPTSIADSNLIYEFSGTLTDGMSVVLKSADFGTMDGTITFQ